MSMDTCSTICLKRMLIGTLGSVTCVIVRLNEIQCCSKMGNLTGRLSVTVDI